MSLDLDNDADDQDLAETFDEENITPDGFDIATSDMEGDVLDVTSAEEDDEGFDGGAFDEQNDEDFDPDSADEGEIEMLLEEDDGIDASRNLPRDDGDLVMASDETPADYESEGPADDVVDDYADEEEATDKAGRSKTSGSGTTPHKERELDEGLEETFPASDPVSVNPGAD